MTPATVDCAGVSRDLGVQQGRAWAGALRAGLGSGAHRWRSWLAPPRSSLRQLERDFWRHFPHLAERTSGLALGARVPRRALIQALRGTPPVQGVAAEPGRTGAGPLALALFGGESPVHVRRSRPEAGIPALEVTFPWLAAALAGVNEEGLAVLALPGPSARDLRAPAFLLGQDCLQRFSTADAAVDWCLKRPAGGTATLIVADARGRVAGAAADGERRRVLAPESGLLPGDPGGELAKACGDEARLDPSGLARAARAAAGPCVAVWLDPTARRLGVTDAGGAAASRIFSFDTRL